MSQRGIETCCRLEGCLQMVSQEGKVEIANGGDDWRASLRFAPQYLTIVFPRAMVPSSIAIVAWYILGIFTDGDPRATGWILDRRD